MSKVVETLRSLVGRHAHYQALVQFEKIPGVPQLGTLAPNYQVALDLFDDRYPDRSNGNKWMRLRQGFNQAFEEFHDEFQHNLDQLVADKKSRDAYLKRTFNRLYSGPGWGNQRREEFAKYFQSEPFKKLKSEIGIELWNELDTIGYATSQSIAFSKSLDYSLENEFKIEGMPVEGGWLWKESETEQVIDQNRTDDNKSSTSTQSSFLDEIAKIEADLGDKGVIINPSFYTPISTLWDSLANNKVQGIRELYRKEVKDQVEFASRISNIYMDEYKVAIKKQPDKQIDILREYRDKYVNLLAERYKPIENWYYTFWNEESKTVEKIDDLESEVFFFCHRTNKSFMVGQKLLQRLYGCCIAIDRFNELLNPSDSQLKSNSAEAPAQKDKNNNPLTARQQVLLTILQNGPAYERSGDNNKYNH